MTQINNFIYIIDSKGIKDKSIQENQEQVVYSA